MTDLIMRLRDVAIMEYGSDTREGLELLQAADMLERVWRTDPGQFGEASIAVAAIALSAFNRRKHARRSGAGRTDALTATVLVEAADRAGYLRDPAPTFANSGSG